MAKLVSKVYGDALFELAIEQDKLESVRDEVQTVSQALKDNPDFLPTLMHPDMTMEKKQEMVRKVFSTASDDMMGLIDVMIRKNRIGELGKVMDYFEMRAKERLKVGVVMVSTPIQLSEEDRKKVEKRVLEVTDFASLEMKYIVDPALLGGMVIRIGDQVLDNSIRSKLDAMGRQLAAVRLGGV